MNATETVLLGHELARPARVPRAYRVFQGVYLVLTLNFFFPALSYLIDPGVAVGQVDRINRMLGGGAYAPIESGQVWHMLAVGNVMTLAFLCFLILIDLRRFMPALPGLAFLKAFSSLYSLGIALRHHLPVFYAVFVLDGVSVAAMIVFAISGRRALLRPEARDLLTPLDRLLLLSPRNIERALQRVKEAKLVDPVPTPRQIAQGIARMWQRVLFRPETIGTCAQDPVRSTFRARLLHHRPLRFPFLVWERAIAPLDLSGLASAPERIVQHLLCAHHDGVQALYDLEILALFPGALQALRDRVREVVEQDTSRTRWLRDLVVYERYHGRLLVLVERAIDGTLELPTEAANDPDLSFAAYLRWCAAQQD